MTEVLMYETLPKPYIIKSARAEDEEGNLMYWTEKGRYSTIHKAVRWLNTYEEQYPETVYRLYYNPQLGGLE